MSNVAVASVAWTHSMALSHYQFLKHCNMQLLCLLLACSLPPSLPRSHSLRLAKSFHEATQRVIKYLWLLSLSPKYNVLVFSREAWRTVQEKKRVDVFVDKCEVNVKPKLPWPLSVFPGQVQPFGPGAIDGSRQRSKIMEGWKHNQSLEKISKWRSNTLDWWC